MYTRKLNFELNFIKVSTVVYFFSFFSLVI